MRYVLAIVSALFWGTIFYFCWEDMDIFQKVLAFVVLVTFSVGGYYLKNFYDYLNDCYDDGCI